MSREDLIIVKMKNKRGSYRGLTNPDSKRKARDADIVIDADGVVVKERYGVGLGQRHSTEEEREKAEEIL